MSPQELADKLAAPFPARDVEGRPGRTPGRAVAPEAIASRLEEVCGLFGWDLCYRPITEGRVVCELSLKVGDEWITRSAIGPPVEVLALAASMFGIGRYLAKVTTPALPPWALPPADAPTPSPTKSSPPLIDPEVAREIHALMAEARILGVNGKPEYSGVFAHFGVAKLGDLTIADAGVLKRLIKTRDPLILPGAQKP